MMRSKYMLGLFLLVLVFSLSGCGPHPGQTKEEVKREHIRNSQINGQELREDIDKTFLFDKPSTLTDRRIP
jgi:uncharacterized lipoprotein YehR (DUF1307 family)